MLVEQKDTRKVQRTINETFAKLPKTVKQAQAPLLADKVRVLNSRSSELCARGPEGNVMKFAAGVVRNHNQPFSKKIRDFHHMFLSKPMLTLGHREDDCLNNNGAAEEVEHQCIVKCMGRLLDRPVPQVLSSAATPSMSPSVVSAPPAPSSSEPVWEPKLAASPTGSTHPCGVQLSLSNRKWLENVFNLVVQCIDRDGCCGHHAAASLHGMSTLALVKDMHNFVRNRERKYMKDCLGMGDPDRVMKKLEGVMDAISRGDKFLSDRNLWFADFNMPILSALHRCTHIVFMTHNSERPIWLYKPDTPDMSFRSISDFENKMRPELEEGLTIEKELAHNKGHYNAIVSLSRKEHAHQKSPCPVMSSAATQSNLQNPVLSKTTHLVTTMIHLTTTTKCLVTTMIRRTTVTVNLTGNGYQTRKMPSLLTSTKTSLHPNR